MERIELLTEHYEKTYETTLKVWEQRNKTFLVLLAVVGVATLLTFKVSQTQPLLVDLIAKTLSITDANRIAELRLSLPYGVIQSILMMVILYLTVILYHRTTFILRNYLYLGALETEIRPGMGLTEESVAFTREGKFYQDHQPCLSRIVGLAYVVMLGILLFAFFGMRIYTDLSTGTLWFTIIDAFLSLSSLIFFVAYACASSSIVQNLARPRSTSS